MQALDSIKAFISRELILKLSSYLGESEFACSKAFDASVSSLLLALSGVGENKEDLMAAWEIIHKEDNPIELLDHLEDLFQGKSAYSMPGHAGSNVLNQLYGGNNKLLQMLSDYAGFTKSNAASKLVSVVSPFVISFLKKKMQTDHLKQTELVQWVAASKNDLENALPYGWSGLLGISIGNQETKSKSIHISEPSYSEQKNWWIWVIGVIALIAGLWFLMKGCNKSELMDRANNAIEGVAAVVDSAKIKAELATKSAIEMMDSSAIEFKKRWYSLGSLINVKLGNIELKLPEKGVELKLLEWLQNTSSVVDKNTWFNFDRILFETGSAQLNAISNEQISNIAGILKAMPNVEFKIGGYTDNTGDTKANIQLSQERANAVMQALIDLGIPSNRLTAEGYGPEHPVADNSTAEGREQNRRVAIRVTKK
ncbi:MAG: OmpA family protein [Saprospiraceae bacterium]